jgi:hypothetical protein
MNRAKKKSRARIGGLLALALGVAALLAIPVVSAARDGGGAEDGVHHGKRHHHHRHHGDREVSGTIAAFDANSGRLTIETSGGDSLSGLIDSRTKIKCEDQGEAGRHHNRGDDRRGRSGEAEPGGDSGPSGHDDNGTGANCTTATLVVGAVVQEADLEIEHGTAHFDEVELAH